MISVATIYCITDWLLLIYVSMNVISGVHCIHKIGELVEVEKIALFPFVMQLYM